MAVTFDAKSYAQDFHPAASPVAWAHTCAGSDRLLIVCLGLSDHDAATVTGVTYNGVAMTLVGGATEGSGDLKRRYEMWRLIAPATGAHNVSVAFTGTDLNVEAVAVSFSNAHQTDPIETYGSASGTGAPASIQVASGEDQLVIDCLVRQSSDPPTCGAGQTLQYAISSQSVSTKVGSVATQMLWTWPNAVGPWLLGAIAIRQLNRAPNPPTGLVRANFDKAAEADFAWTFSDPDSGDTQSSYQLKIVRASDSVEVYDSGVVGSSTSFHSLTAGTLVNNVQYQWKVKTWDRDAAGGDYSVLASFWCSATPTATITYPAINHDDVTGPSLTLTWTYSDPEAEAQTAYALILTAHDEMFPFLYESGKVSGDVTEAVIDYELENGHSYIAYLVLYDGKGVESVTKERHFDAVFTNPPTPTVVDTGEATSGRIKLVITNPAPGGGEPALDHNDIYRRVSGESAWVRIATDVGTSATYYDYAVASGVTYEYKVRAIGVTGTFADSATHSLSITFTGVWMHDVASPAATAHQYVYDGRGRASDWSIPATYLQFAGRVAPVVELGESATTKVSIGLELLRTGPDRAILEAFVQTKPTVCYRDGAGRKLFGVVAELSLDDQPQGTDADFTVEGIDFSEAV